jgi:predicted small lipoprotein YifL
MTKLLMAIAIALTLTIAGCGKGKSYMPAVRHTTHLNARPSSDTSAGITMIGQIEGYGLNLLSSPRSSRAI